MNSLFPHCRKAETVTSGQKHTQDSLQVATFYVTKAGNYGIKVPFLVQSTEIIFPLKNTPS